MTIRLLSIGKTQHAYLKQGIAMYVERLHHYAKVEYLEINDVPNNGLTADQLKIKEAEMVLKLLKPEHALYLLDERGREYSSREFAGFFQKQMNAGTKTIVLLIGGAYGFAPALQERALGKLSMSKLTLPHELVRLFLVEQVYRAFTIIKGEKYHHD